MNLRELHPGKVKPDARVCQSSPLAYAALFLKSGELFGVDGNMIKGAGGHLLAHTIQLGGSKGSVAVTSRRCNAE